MNESIMTASMRLMRKKLPPMKMRLEQKMKGMKGWHHFLQVVENRGPVVQRNDLENGN